MRPSEGTSSAQCSSQSTGLNRRCCPRGTVMCGLSGRSSTENPCRTAALRCDTIPALGPGRGERIGSRRHRVDALGDPVDRPVGQRPANRAAGDEQPAARRRLPFLRAAEGLRRPGTSGRWWPNRADRVGGLSTGGPPGHHNWPFEPSAARGQAGGSVSIVMAWRSAYTDVRRTSIRASDQGEYRGAGGRCPRASTTQADADPVGVAVLNQGAGDHRGARRAARVVGRSGPGRWQDLYDEMPNRWCSGLVVAAASLIGALTAAALGVGFVEVREATHGAVDRQRSLGDGGRPGRTTSDRHIVFGFRRQLIDAGTGCRWSTTGLTPARRRRTVR